MSKVLGKLEEAWINERNSPELLLPRMEMVQQETNVFQGLSSSTLFKVDCMLEQLKTMEGNLARYDLFTSTTISEYFEKQIHGNFLQAEQR